MMDIQFADGWDNRGNHDSSYDVSEIMTLIGQCRDIASLNDANFMPEAIAAFVRNCLNGDTTIWVTKGIHQRWSTNTQPADPHIQVSFNHKFRKNSPEATVRLHVCLSESPIGKTKKRYGETVEKCEWMTVGVSAKRFGLRQNWPAYFTQEVTNIQYQEGGRRGFKRRDSIGLIVPEEFKVALQQLAA